MARRKDLYLKLQADLFREFTRMSEEHENGVPKYSNKFILYKLEQKFYMDSQNIMRIINIQLGKNGQKKTHKATSGQDDQTIRDGLFAPQDDTAGTL